MKQFHQFPNPTIQHDTRVNNFESIRIRQFNKASRKVQDTSEIDLSNFLTKRDKLSIKKLSLLDLYSFKVSNLLLSVLWGLEKRVKGRYDKPELNFY